MTASVPRYLRIYKEILQDIRSDVLSPGDLLPSEANLCERFSASRPTVARALKMLSDEKLVRRKAGFGTQLLHPPKGKLVAGLLIPQFSKTEIFEPISRSIAEAAGMEGMRVIQPTDLTMVNDAKGLCLSLAEQLIKARVGGVFFAPIEQVEDQTEFNKGIIDSFNEARIPVVLIDRDIFRWPRQSSLDLVGIDNIEAGYVVATHLLKSGCRRIVFVTQGNPASTVQLRRLGCREAFNQFGLQASTLMTATDPLDNPGQVADELLKSGVDGIICANDSTAGPVLRRLLDKGADIPGKIKVCGFDDVKYATLLSVPLTSFRQPCKALGRIAAKTMIQRIKHPDTPVHRVTLQGELIIRESSSAKIT